MTEVADGSAEGEVVGGGYRLELGGVEEGTAEGEAVAGGEEDG